MPLIASLAPTHDITLAISSPSSYMPAQKYSQENREIFATHQQIFFMSLIASIRSILTILITDGVLLPKHPSYPIFPLQHFWHYCNCEEASHVHLSKIRLSYPIEVCTVQCAHNFWYKDGLLLRCAHNLRVPRYAVYSQHYREIFSKEHRNVSKKEIFSWHMHTAKHFKYSANTEIFSTIKRNIFYTTQKSGFPSPLRCAHNLQVPRRAV